MKKGIVEVLQTEMLNFCSPVIVNNLPSIDGLLCSQRQVIWGMFKAKMTSDKQFYKMLKASGRIFDYYVLGDMPLCSVMKNMGNNYVLNKYLMPKGSFGNKNLKDGTGSAPRYIECKLDKYSECMLEGINKNAVKMKKNYDATENEPVILPSKIPNILTNLRMSIAVSEANRMPSHNIIDTCNSIQSYIKNKDIDESINLIKVPDLPSGGIIIYDKSDFNKIYKTGKGSFTNLGKYKYDKKTNTITIYEIPYTTYIENIEDELEKNINKFSKELVDYHNSSDKDGLKLELYLKKNASVDMVIQKLRKYTSFESKFSCNFTILDLDGKTPKLMNLQNIYDTWIQHRINCIKNETMFDINKNKEELNKLYGLKIINDDLDKAIQIIRSSKTEKLAIEKLINHFNLNEKQAEYVSTIRLVNINQEWIERKITNIKELESENIKLTEYYNSEKNIKETIITQLEEVKKKFGKPRKTEIIYPDDIQEITQEDLIEDNTVTLVLTKEGYLKKNLKYSESQKLKDNDEITQIFQTTNKTDILLFTNKGNVLLRKTYELDECLPSAYGTFIPNWLGEYLKEDEKIIHIAATKDYKGQVLTVFENGNIGSTDLKKYKCKTNRQVPMDAYNTESPLVDIKVVTNDVNIFLLTQKGKALIVNTKDSKIRPTKSRDTKGVRGISIEGDNKVIGAIIDCNEDNFTIYTEKGKKIDYMLDDVATNTEKSWIEYLTMRRGNKGNYMYNTKQKKDKIVKMKIRK